MASHSVHYNSEMQLFCGVLTYCYSFPQSKASINKNNRKPVFLFSEYLFKKTAASDCFKTSFQQPPSASDIAQAIGRLWQIEHWVDCHRPHEKAPHIHCHSGLPAVLCCYSKDFIFISRAHQGLLWTPWHLAQILQDSRAVLSIQNVLKVLTQAAKSPGRKTVTRKCQWFPRQLTGRTADFQSVVFIKLPPTQ